MGKSASSATAKEKTRSMGEFGPLMVEERKGMKSAGEDERQWYTNHSLPTGFTCHTGTNKGS